MIRKTLVTLALTAGMVGGTAGIASAHECFVANRSAQGNAGASHSANWYTLEVSELYASAHVFLSEDPTDPLPALTEEQVADAVARTSAAGIPTSFTVFERFTIPRNLQEMEDLTAKSADGKGIDHFFYAYGEQIIGIYFDIALGGPA